MEKKEGQRKEKAGRRECGNIFIKSPAFDK